jgi:hypothetical protein
MDLFTTSVLNGVVETLKPAPQFLLDMFFPTIQTETTEEIHFDVFDGKRRLAPFVSPLVEGKIVEQQGFSTNTYAPAYIKDKRVFDPSKAFKRLAGEQIAGTMLPMDRQRALMARNLTESIDMIHRRMECMAASVLLTSALTISGDGYPSVSLSFGRSSDCVKDISGAATQKWSATTAKPLDDLQDWAQVVMQKTGIYPRTVIMPVDVWKHFRANDQVKDRLDLRRVSQGNMNLGAADQEGGVFMGNVDGFDIYVYSGWYAAENDGTETAIWTAKKIVLTSPAMKGVRCFGAIKDEAAGLQAREYFVKSWVQEDPSVRFVLVQSAPLVVPYLVNASLVATTY